MLGRRLTFSRQDVTDLDWFASVGVLSSPSSSTADGEHLPQPGIRRSIIGVHSIVHPRFVIEADVLRQCEPLASFLPKMGRGIFVVDGRRKFDKTRTVRSSTSIILFVGYQQKILQWSILADGGATAVGLTTRARPGLCIINRQISPSNAELLLMFGVLENLSATSRGSRSPWSTAGRSSTREADMIRRLMLVGALVHWDLGFAAEPNHWTDRHATAIL